MDKQYFTLQEARRLLPEIRELIGKGMLITQKLQVFAEKIQPLAERSEENTGSPEGTEYIYHLLVLKRCLGQIEEMGVLVKSVQEGLVDFPHLRDGREVYLCWKYGEDDIDYYHEVDAGFAGRTPLGDS